MRIKGAKRGYKWFLGPKRSQKPPGVLFSDWVRPQSVPILLASGNP